MSKYELIAREYTYISALFHSNDPKVHLSHALMQFLFLSQFIANVHESSRCEGYETNRGI